MFYGREGEIRREGNGVEKDNGSRAKAKTKHAG